jgi:hypothetical protein
MNPCAGTQKCISLTYIMPKFSLLGREGNLDVYRFTEYFTPNFVRKFMGESEVCLN